jgi:hypothetical protein
MSALPGGPGGRTFGSMLASRSGTAVGARVALTHEPPTNAVVLFDGGDLSGWSTVGDGRPDWRVHDGCLEVVPGAGDLVTHAVFTDFQLHLEFWLPHIREATGQDRAASGVFLQGRYEIQILDSFGMEATIDGCGSLYKLFAPLWNACRRTEAWQAFDVAFRAPRLDTNGMVCEHARVTVFQNGVMIHDNVTMPRPTEGALDAYEARPGPLRLQDHGSRVRFRNIWVVPATLEER